MPDIDRGPREFVLPSLSSSTLDVGVALRPSRVLGRGRRRRRRLLAACPGFDSGEGATLYSGAVGGGGGGTLVKDGDAGVAARSPYTHIYTPTILFVYR